MLADTLSITYNAVSITLTKETEANYASRYSYDGGTLKYVLEIKHTVPATGDDGESHLVKLTVQHYDANGVYLKSCSAWTVIKTFDQVQNSTDAQRAGNALVGLTTSTFLGLIVARQT